MSNAEVTILNSMAGADYEAALDLHKAWGLKWADLKNDIYGKWTVALTPEEAQKAKDALVARDIGVYCMCTSTFFDDIENGYESFKEKHLGKIDHIIALAKIFQPKMVRIVAAQLIGRTPEQNAVKEVKAKHSWVIGVYQEAIDRLNEAGFTPNMENEVRQCMLSKPEEFLDFFELLDRDGKIGLIWDVQNQWATGPYPTVEMYRQLKPLIRYLHVKGGQHENGDKKLKWNVALEDTNWPMLDITKEFVKDGMSPVICINPPQHGAQKPGYDYADVTKRDIDFLRANVPGLN